MESANSRYQKYLTVVSMLFTFIPGHFNFISEDICYLSLSVKHTLSHTHIHGCLKAPDWLTYLKSLVRLIFPRPP